MLNICIVGATGLVGRQMLKELLDFNLSNIEVDLYASAKSKGQIIQEGGIKFTVKELHEQVDFTKYDISLFSAGKEISRKFAPLFAKADCYVIDNSSEFRQDQDKALVTMGVNLEEIKNYKNKIIANPNCSTIQSVIALNKINKVLNIVDIDYVTYQSVSGSGVKGIEDLENTAKGDTPNCYKYPISNNVIPQIDKMSVDGYTFEEEKMINETKKILNIDCNVSATCVRVPLKSGHTVQMRIQLDQEVELEEITKLLKEQRHLNVLTKGQLPMPLNVFNKSYVDVGRIRRHHNQKNIIFLMTVADNLKVGAATNACEIAKYLIEEEIC